MFISGDKIIFDKAIKDNIEALRFSPQLLKLIDQFIYLNSNVSSFESDVIGTGKLL